MTWFLIALLVALGGIYVAWKRGKDMPVIVPKKAVDPNAPHIDIKDPKDLERWAKELGVDKWDLEDAVRNAGPDADAVRKELRGK